MIEVLDNWLKRYFSDPDVVILLVMLFAGLLIITSMGDMLAPVLAGIVIAYLLDWGVTMLSRCRLPHSLAVWIIFLIFCGLLASAMLGLLPKLWQQLSNLFQELPHMLGKGRTLLMALPERYPEYISASQINHVFDESKTHIASLGQWILSFSIASLTNGIVIVVYLILVPILAFFFLKDKSTILNWSEQYLPDHSRLLRQVWHEVNEQLGNYVRGKVLEVIIVSVVTFICFAILGLRYAMLLSVLVGLSVIIPYVGAVLVTIPVVVIGFLQWGFHQDYLILMIAYTIIIAVDANVLVPLLFSEVVNLHPVAIIIAVLMFGGIWGFWGVFFAIPLATLVKAVLTAWQSSLLKQT